VTTVARNELEISCLRIIEGSGKRKSMRTVFAQLAPALLLLMPLARAQPSSGTPAPAELIDHLVANAEVYRARLPSITANETIESEGSYMTIFRRRVEAKGIFRVIRDPASGELNEQRQVAEVDGKAVEPGQRLNLPWTLGGGFEKFPEMFFTREHRLCYTFTLLPEPGPGNTQQIAIDELPPEQRTPACVASSRGFTGLIRVDPATRQLVYIERTTTDEMAERYHLAPFASVAVAPAKIGDDTFWLPTVVIGTYTRGKVKGKFIAHYSGYHRFTGSITILPGVTAVGSPDSTPAPKPVMPPPN
jgi:hypothetical protein